jgi:hypothetical protein
MSDMEHMAMRWGVRQEMLPEGLRWTIHTETEQGPYYMGAVPRNLPGDPTGERTARAIAEAHNVALDAGAAPAATLEVSHPDRRAERLDAAAQADADAQPRRSATYPHACAVLAREAERLLHTPRITLETPAEQRLRAANERYAALELARAEQALLFADDQLAALRELVAAAKRNDGGGMDDATVWLRRAVKEAEEVL